VAKKGDLEKDYEGEPQGEQGGGKEVGPLNRRPSVSRAGVTETAKPNKKGLAGLV